jgi:hypothetical protein
MDNPLEAIFGNMLKYRDEHPDKEYFHLVQDIESIISARGGNIHTSKILRHIQDLKDFEQNMKVQGASKEQLRAVYQEALKDLYPLQAKLRSQ